ncbi:hypothetical protein RB195_010037 [Necator americanus]|uniref:Uncharacterized protein n=1 Tax=Necator americanus TaxID=51031 RepID=A0ABR1CW51_NECAM
MNNGKPSASHSEMREALSFILVPQKSDRRAVIGVPVPVNLADDVASSTPTSYKESRNFLGGLEVVRRRYHAFKVIFGDFKAKTGFGGITEDPTIRIHIVQ